MNLHLYIPLLLDEIFTVTWYFYRLSLFSRKGHTYWNLGIQGSQNFVFLDSTVWALFSFSSSHIFFSLASSLMLYIYVNSSGWISTNMVLMERGEVVNVKPCVQRPEWFLATEYCESWILIQVSWRKLNLLLMGTIMWC